MTTAQHQLEACLNSAATALANSAGAVVVDEGKIVGPLWSLDALRQKFAELKALAVGAEIPCTHIEQCEVLAIVQFPHVYCPCGQDDAA